MLTAFLTVGILLQAVKKSALDSTPGKLLVFLLAFWLIFQMLLAQSGFYHSGEKFPPNLLIFGPLPALVLIGIYFAFFRLSFVNRLPLKTLTILHVVRIPVEIVLYWLSIHKLIPISMTFNGRNFDILAGFTAVLVYFFAFRGESPNRKVLIVWNFLALGLLANIVITAVSAIRAFNPNAALTEINRAVEYFPYVWLPTLIVPIVFFSHLAALSQLFSGGGQSAERRAED